MTDYEAWRACFYRLLNDLNEAEKNYNGPLDMKQQQDHIDMVLEAVGNFAVGAAALRDVDA